MRMTWVNHASFVIEHEQVRLICDPWIDGRVFDNGWALLSRTKFGYDDFADITHIWFSHEHPDHFFPPNLKRISPEIRRRITVLFKHTKDKRVVTFCRSLGFKAVHELQDEWVSLSATVDVLCRTVDGGDSWLAIKAGGQCLLNLNDCVLLSAQDLLPIKAAVGPLDALVTQFSYASWWGNRADVDKRRTAARETLAKIRLETDVLQPRAVLLAASFVVFCHEENSHMNDEINQVSDAFDFVKKSTKARPVVLYPGDDWTVGHASDSSAALRKYAADYTRALAQPVQVHPANVSLQELKQSAARFMQRLRRKNSDLLLRRLRSAAIFLTDLKVSVRLSLAGLREISPLSYDRHDIALSSAAFLYCLKFPWGGETLMVNGRFEAPAAGERYRFFRWFAIAHANNRFTFYDGRYYQAKLRNLVARLTA